VSDALLSHERVFERRASVSDPARTIKLICACGW
jgi:hypothetical protein